MVWWGVRRRVGLKMWGANRKCGLATGTKVGFEGFGDARVGLLDVILERAYDIINLDHMMS